MSDNMTENCNAAERGAGAVESITNISAFIILTLRYLSCGMKWRRNNIVMLAKPFYALRC